MAAGAESCEVKPIHCLIRTLAKNERRAKQEVRMGPSIRSKNEVPDWGPWTAERQKSGHMESAKLCCRSHLAAELKLQDSGGWTTMRYAKRILVAAAIFSSCSAALAFDKKEIGSALADSPGGSSSKKSTDSGAPAAKPNAPTASGSGYAAKARERLKGGRPVLVVQQLSSGSSTLSSNKDIRLTTSAGNITFHGSTPLTVKIFWRRPNCRLVVSSAPRPIIE